MSTSVLRQVVNFDSEFELDVESRTLRRGGRVLRLERIPMEILRLLVVEAGQVVTRERIVEHVWGRGVALDSDNSINGAIRKIRTVLRDVPEQPRFIQTITGTGYRFIARIADPEKTAPPEKTDPGRVADSGKISESRTIADPHPTAASNAAGPDAPCEPASAAELRVERPTHHPWLVGTGVVAMAIGVVAMWLLWSAAARQPQAGERLMLAVLPFENLTGDAAQEYFSDAMTEEMIAQLGQLDPHRLGVIARTSVMPFKLNRNGLDEIARKLAVHYVLEGSVRRDAGRLRIAVQLIQVADQTHVWAKQYDREAFDVLRVQAEIAHAVAREIELTFDGRTTSDAVLSPQAFDAYDLYLKGRYHWNKRTRAGFSQAIDYFQAALAKDPGYARAHAGLADAYALMGTYGFAPEQDVMPKARAAAVRAIELDETLGEAHASLALVVQMHEWDWRRAEQEFRRAIELDSNYVTARHWYAEHLALTGRFEEALAESSHARQLDPLSLIIAADHGAILYFSRQYDRAIEQFRAVLAVEPNFRRAHMIVAAYVQNGQFDDALAHVQHWQKFEEGPWTWAWMAYLHGRAGRIDEARRALQEMEKSNRRAKLDVTWLSVIAYAGIGQSDDVLTWLDRAHIERSSAVVTSKVDPIFDRVREDPRFNGLLRRVGFVDAR